MTYDELVAAVRTDLAGSLPKAEVFGGLEGNCWKYPPYEACIRLTKLHTQFPMTVHVVRIEDGKEKRFIGVLTRATRSELTAGLDILMFGSY